MWSCLHVVMQNPFVCALPSRIEREVLGRVLKTDLDKEPSDSEPVMAWTLRHFYKECHHRRIQAPLIMINTDAHFNFTRKIYEGSPESDPENISQRHKTTTRKRKAAK